MTIMVCSHWSRMWKLSITRAIVTSWLEATLAIEHFAGSQVQESKAFDLEGWGLDFVSLVYASLYMGGHTYPNDIRDSIFDWVKTLISTVSEHGMAFRLELELLVSLKSRFIFPTFPSNHWWLIDWLGFLP